MPEAAHIHSLADKHFKAVQEIRHHLHRHPELSFQEFETWNSNYWTPAGNSEPFGSDANAKPSSILPISP